MIFLFSHSSTTVLIVIVIYVFKVHLQGDGANFPTLKEQVHG